MFKLNKNIDSNKVQSFLNERHGKNVLIINLSGRFYDYTKFSNNVININ